MRLTAILVNWNHNGLEYGNSQEPYYMGNSGGLLATQEGIRATQGGYIGHQGGYMDNSRGG